MTPAGTAAARATRADVLRDMSAREIAALVSARELSASEVVEHFAARLSAVNVPLNAVAVDLSETARKAAAGVDAALARGEKPGPLAGLPVTIKECFDLAGTASTFGLPARRDIIESTDDSYVAALRAAGAIPLAKSNVPQLLIFTETDNPLYGRTNNPWDVERSCGGSSGGEAALIAAGASPLGLGNDIGGSLRIPAAFCGIAAIRPTAGRTPDHCAHGLPIGQRTIVSQAGPMARHVEDLTLALGVLDRARDPFVDPGPALGDPGQVDVARLRFARFSDDGEFPVAPAARRAVEEAAAMLRAAGAAEAAWQPPRLSEASDLFFACLSADRGRGFMRLLHGNRMDARIRTLLLTAKLPAALRGILALALASLGQRHAARLLRRFGSGSADDYWRMVERMMNWRRDFSRSLDAAEGGPIDLILCPAYAVPAQRHGASLLMPLPGAYAPLAPVTGFPAGVVPVTRVRSGEESDRPATRDRTERTARESEHASAGLPIAVQVIARPWRDHVALAAMMTIEAAARKRPDYPLRPDL